MNVAELIKRLEYVRDDLGPETDVVLPSGVHGYVKSVISTTTAIVGKSDRSKLVSRGGVPVFVLKG